jgi:hypothetical protein
MPKPRISIEEFKARLSRVHRDDWIRLAAFIDGEGCITISSAPERGRATCTQFNLSVTVTNTSPKLFEWLCQTFGGKAIAANANWKKPNTRPVWRWLINELQGVEILRGCLPYFIIKREQAEVALSFRNLKEKRFEQLGTRQVTADEIGQRLALQKKIKSLNSDLVPFDPSTATFLEN